MGDKINVTLQTREVQGKKVSRLRKQGVIPGIVYGHGFEPILVQSEYNPLERVVRDAGKHSPVYADIDGKRRLALIKDIDRDPIKGQIRHVAFHAVKADEVVTAEVPIKLIGEGESEAEKAGLILLQAVESIEIKAKPANLPESLEAVVSGLADAEDKVLLGDIKLPKGVEYADAEQDLELAIVNVYEPAALEAANDAAAGDADGVGEVEVAEEAVDKAAEKTSEPA